MKYSLIFLLLLTGITLNSCGNSKTAFSHKTKYFETKRDYIYKALYIDSSGDTITNERLILRTLDRRWIGQPWLQRSIKYIYDTDTADYKNYTDPDPYFRERNIRRYKNRGEYPLSEKEITGGYQDEHYFYMHPPRSNQYRMLFHAAHPRFFSRVLEKGIDTVTATDQQFYGAGYMNQEYRYQDLGKDEILGDSITLYQVNVISKLVTEKEKFKKKIDFYASTFDALFCFEYGFIKMHYEFKSGVKIEFDLIEVIDKS